MRAGSGVQSLLMVLKTIAILGLVATGLAAFGGERVTLVPVLDRPPSFGLVAAMGASLVPVLFAYGGWQTSGFVMGELRRPERDMPRALLLGVAGVVVLYLSVNLVCLRALGADGLAQSRAPASDVMRLALGERGARLIALGIVISTLGFLAQGILTAPRVYYAMARDGLFLPAAARVHPRFRTPVLAITAQAIWSSVLVLSGTLSQLVAYTGFAVVLFSGIAVLAVFVLRHREPDTERPFKAFGYPWAPAFFVIASAAIVVNEIWSNPGTSLAGLGIIAAGVPLYLVFQARRSR